MKLYTEEQVKQVIATFNIEKFVSTDELLEELKLTPIELPSDEEIERVLKPHSDEYAAGYIGAIDMIEEKILNQNK